MVKRKIPKRKVEDSYPSKVVLGSWGGVFGKEATLRGQKYYFYKSSIRLASAKKMVRGLRGKGYKARIIVPGVLSGYGVYSYPKVGKK